MCTKPEKKEMVSFLVSRINLSKDEVIRAIALAKERIKADGVCPKFLNPDQILEEICANAALYGVPRAGQELAIRTECSLYTVGMFMPTPSISV